MSSTDQTQRKTHHDEFDCEKIVTTTYRTKQNHTYGSVLKSINPSAKVQPFEP